MDKNKTKRAIIIFIYLLILVLIGALIYFWVKPEENCLDGVRNQNEEDVDCGGICTKKCDKIVIEDLVVEQGGVLDNGAVNRADLYGKIYNPNSVFGSNKFEYEFVLKDSAGQVISSKKGTSFILPGESKYIIENNIEVNSMPASADLSIKEADWVEFKDQYEKPQVKIVNKQYGQISSGIGFSEALGLLKNESPFDFSAIKIIIILKDASDKIIALNSTEMRTVRSGENRDFRSLWFNRFPGEVSSVEVQSEINVFDNDAYANKYFSPESLPSAGYR